jgi:hypothetical protein
MGEPITLYGGDGNEAIVNGKAQLAALLETGDWSIDRPEPKKSGRKAVADEPETAGQKSG